MEPHANEPEVFRKTIYRAGMSYVEVKLSGAAPLAEVRVWRGHRWPDLERVWYARMRSWMVVARRDSPGPGAPARRSCGSGSETASSAASRSPKRAAGLPK